MTTCQIWPSPRDRRGHELERIFAHPFGGPGENPELAASRIDQHRGRHAERPADRLEILEHLGAWVGVIGEAVDMCLAQPGFRLLRVALIDVDRDDLKSRAAEPRLQSVERRHLLAAGYAPGGPQIEQDRPAAPFAERFAVSRRVE